MLAIKMALLLPLATDATVNAADNDDKDKHAATAFPTVAYEHDYKDHDDPNDEKNTITITKK